MSTCRASKDEQNHDFKQMNAVDDRELLVEKTYQNFINDPIWLWEALGPDGFKPPHKHRGRYFQQRNKAAEAAHRQAVSNALLTRDDAELGRLLGDMARQYLLEAAEGRVDG